MCSENTKTGDCCYEKSNNKVCNGNDGQEAEKIREDGWRNAFFDTKQCEKIKTQQTYKTQNPRHQKQPSDIASRDVFAKSRNFL